MIKLIIYFLFCNSTCLIAQSKCDLVITIRGVQKNDTLIIQSKIYDTYNPIDTFLLFAGKINQRKYNFKDPAFISVSIKSNNFYKQLIVDNSVELIYDFNGNKEATIAGSPNTTELENIQKQFVKPARAKIISLNSQIHEYARTKDSGKVDSLLDAQSLIALHLADSFKSYIYNNPASLVSVDLIDWGFNRYSLSEVRNMISSLSNNIKKHSVTEYLMEKVERESVFSDSMKAPCFNVTDERGAIFSSSIYKNNLILIDFWGTWCGPCVISLPELVSLNNRFKDKGLKLISYANEYNFSHEHFKNIEKKHNITWQSFYEFSNNPTNILQVFSITEYPTYILIKDGIIIKKTSAGNGLKIIEGILDTIL